MKQWHQDSGHRQERAVITDERKKMSYYFKDLLAGESSQIMRQREEKCK